MEWDWKVMDKMTKGPYGIVVKNLKSKGVYEPQLLQWTKRFDLNGKNIVDVGAGVGSHSVYWALNTNADNIYAFEPMKSGYNAIIGNAEKNGIKNIIAYNKALSDKEGETILNEKWAKARIKSECRTLDSYEFENIGLIKIDVEGQELKVLKGAVKTLKEQSPILAVEEWNNNRKDVDEYVKSLGYKQIKEFQSGTPMYIYERD